MKFQYFDYFADEWKFYERGKSFDVPADTCDNGCNKVHSIELNDIVTKGIRIYPLEWHKYNQLAKIGMRIGFIGVSKKPKRCDKMISACEVDKIVKDKLDMQTQLQDEIDMSVKEVDHHHKRHSNLENRISDIEESLNNSRMELMLEKNNIYFERFPTM